LKLRYQVGIIIFTLAVVFLCGRCGKIAVRNPHQPIALPNNETERITVDPDSHTITIQTPNGIRTETLPDRKSIFDVSNNGTVKVTSAQMGFEHHPFIGWQVSNQGRLCVGADLWYFKKLDLGIGVASKLGEGTPVALAKLSYNFWSNCQMALTYDTGAHIGGMLSVRI
jgi:hypothetical protein